jgi:hypothetical protein
MTERGLGSRARTERQAVSVPLPKKELRDLVEPGPLTYLSTSNADGSPQ